MWLLHGYGFLISSFDDVGVGDEDLIGCAVSRARHYFASLCFAWVHYVLSGID